MRQQDPYEARARELCQAAGTDPDSRVQKVGSGRGMPAWCAYRQPAREEHVAQEQADAVRARELAKSNSGIAGQQPERYQGAPLHVLGNHEANTIGQMHACMGVGNVVGAALCADGHLGYAQPVGAVIAYENQISISGVGFDIACGNMAVRLDVPYAHIAPMRKDIAHEINRCISFGVGRTNAERVEHELLDDADAWAASGMGDYKAKAAAQLGTVGSGNHYVDVLRDEDGWVWVGVHFGSRGLGHTSATRYLKAAGGQDGINVPPTVVDLDSDIGRAYHAAMQLAGRYAYAGREWVVERVRKIIGGSVTDMVHNHHNYAWAEHHNGRDVWVVRKGATPAAPGQRGFVGGSMGDDAVILEGVAGAQSTSTLMSTVHGAGRMFGRKEAKRRFTRTEMEHWLQRQDVNVFVLGGDLDESPMAYRRLPTVLAAHSDSVRVLHTLQPKIVVMAGSDTVDPWKD